VGSPPIRKDDKEELRETRSMKYTVVTVKPEGLLEEEDISEVRRSKRLRRSSTSAMDEYKDISRDESGFLIYRCLMMR
jgi:hypothetical protein